MNTIKIYLKTSGSVAELHKDFAMYVGSFQNKLINVYVPKKMLYSNKQNTFNNTVKIAGLLTATDGKQITTEARYLDYLKEVTIDGVDYVVYERRLPKELTVYPGNQQLVINVVSVDNTMANEPKVLQVVTTQVCNLLVQNSEYINDQETMTPSQLEEVNSKLTENQEDINNLQERMETAETNIAKNTEDISQNTNDIANLKQVVGSGEDYIGTLEWLKSELPSDTELDTFVFEKRQRTSKTSDVIIVIQKITGATDKNYKFIKAIGGWIHYEIPPMELAGNGTAGIVSGTYAVGKDYDTLVDIAGGEILNIYVKDSSNQYRNIVEYLNTNKSSIDKIINGTTKVGVALKAISDGVGNNIVNTYLTKALGVTKSEMRDYAMPREFNDVYYISSQGYSKQVPTSPESGIQFSAIPKMVGDTQLFQISKENSADFELSSKNGYSNNIYITTNKDCEVSFRLSTEYKKQGQESWEYLNIELTAPITLTAGNIEKLVFANPFAYLEEDVISLTNGDLIRQTLEIVTETSDEITFDVISNQTYPSIFNLTSQSYTLSEVESVIGKELVLGGDGIIENKQAIFEIKNAESLVSFKTPYRRFLLNLHLPVSGELDPTYPVLIDFGGMIYNLYNLITGNEEISTIGDLVSVENYSDEGGYFFNLEVIYIQSDDFAGFFVAPSALIAKQIESIIEDSETIVTDLDKSKTKLNIHLSAEIVNKLSKVLTRPMSAPTSTELVAISPQNVQQLLELGVGLEVKNGHLEIVLNDEIAPFVDFSKKQSLTDSQKAQARENIGAGSAVVAVESVNDKTGIVNLTADDVSAVSKDSIADNLTTTDTSKVLSANQGKVISDKISETNQQLSLAKSSITQLSSKTEDNAEDITTNMADIATNTQDINTLKTEQDAIAKTLTTKANQTDLDTTNKNVTKNTQDINTLKTEQETTQKFYDWVYLNQRLTTTLGSVTVDLADILPSTSDDEQYELLIKGWTKNTSGTVGNVTILKVKSDIFTDNITFVESQSQIKNVSYQFSGHMTIVAHRYLYFNSETLDNVAVDLIAYRRVK